MSGSEYPGRTLVREARCGHSVVRRGQEQNHRPTCHVSGIAIINQGEAAEGSTFCPWQTHPAWRQVAPRSGCPVPSHPTLHHKAPPPQLSYYLCPQKRPLSATPKMRAISPGPWRPLSTGIMTPRARAPVSTPKDSTVYGLREIVDYHLRLPEWLREGGGLA